MGGQENCVQGYWVTIKPADDADNTYVVGYRPRELMQVRGMNGKSKPVPDIEYRAIVEASGNRPVTWIKPPPDRSALATFDADARNRVRIMREWLARVNGLIQTVRDWAEDLGWSTKVIDKPVDDSAIGHFRVPALLLQEGATKVLLDPVGRSSPGSEGVVDLYLMPGYDDIASLYFRQDGWHVYRWVADASGPTPSEEAETLPLTKKTFGMTLDELKSHAG